MNQSKESSSFSNTISNTIRKTTRSKITKTITKADLKTVSIKSIIYPFSIILYHFIIAKNNTSKKRIRTEKVFPSLFLIICTLVADNIALIFCSINFKFIKSFRCFIIIPIIKFILIMKFKDII